MLFFPEGIPLSSVLIMVLKCTANQIGLKSPICIQLGRDLVLVKAKA